MQGCNPQSELPAFRDFTNALTNTQLHANNARQQWGGRQHMLWNDEGLFLVASARVLQLLKFHCSSMARRLTRFLRGMHPAAFSNFSLSRKRMPQVVGCLLDEQDNKRQLLRVVHRRKSTAAKCLKLRIVEKLLQCATGC